jgi:hypothetical protein
MDPNVLYRKQLPLDSGSMKALTATEKMVPISVMLDDGTVFPAAKKYHSSVYMQSGLDPTNTA